MSIYAPIAVYAVRYALGRRTAAPDDVLAFIQTHRDDIVWDAGCREAILRDIRESGWGGEYEWRAVVNTLVSGAAEGDA